MDDNNKTLTINISNESQTKTFVYSDTAEFEIDEIKKKCNENFEYHKKDLNNIILYFVDEEKDKNIINNFDELFNFTKEVDEDNLSINIFSKVKDEENNSINDRNKNNKINDNKGNIVKSDLHNNNNENDIIYIKDKEIEKLKNEIYNLKKKNEYDFERYNNLIFYYEEFIKTTKNEKGKVKEKENNESEKKEKKEIKNTNNQIIENDKNGNNIKKIKDEKKENKIKEIKNHKDEKENNVKNNGNEKMENNNKINNEFKENNNFLGKSNQKKDLLNAKPFNKDELILDNNDNSFINEIQINYNEIELVYRKCYFCKNFCNNKIYKDYRQNKYICQMCFKKEIQKTDYDNFFEIKFPPQLINYINRKRKKLGNKPVESFNKVLNNIFFDNEGNFKMKEKNEMNENDFFEVEKIYNDLILINENPVEYFADYQNAFINKQNLKLDNNEKNLINEKLKSVCNILIKLQK